MILELHIHSCFSHDSLMSPRGILRSAAAKGIGGIAVTDHNTIQGGVAAQETREDRDPLVIVGSEVSTDAGDLIGLFLREEIRSRSWRSVVEEIRSQGGIVVLPHPFRGHRLSDDLVSSVDAVETFNSRSGARENLLAVALAERFRKPPVAGSDAHLYCEIGLGRTVVDDEDIRGAILKGHVMVGECSSSQAYLESCSQLIKAIRLRRYSMAPRLLGRVIKDYIFGSYV